MRMLISLLVLAMTAIGLPGLQATERAAVAAPSRAVPSVQARGKKKRVRPRKAMKTEKKAEKKPDGKTKKSDRGFEL
jgi:Tfp pilus assembly protein PilV